MANDGGPKRSSDALASDSDNFLLKKWNWQKWRSTLHWRAHCLLPGVIPNPYSTHEDSMYLRDAESNAESRVDADSELRCLMAWGVELYGPDEIHQLYDGLTKLRWSRVGSTDPENSAVNRVRQMRASSAGSWLNIGRVRRLGEDKPSLTQYNFAKLPHGIESLTVGVYQLTSSTTALVIGFRLDAHLACRYEVELNKDRRTVKRRVPGAWAVEWRNPVIQKSDAVHRSRRELRATLGRWFAGHMPGYFCNTHAHAHFPTMELITAKGLALNESSGPGRKLRDWRRLLTYVGSHDAWVTKKYPGLQIAFDRPLDGDNGLHVLVTLDPSLFPAEAVKHYGARAPDSYAWLCDELLSGTLARAATMEYLKSQSRSLNDVRERMRRARSDRGSVSATLAEIGSFFDRSMGSPAINRELARQSKESHWFDHDCADFHSSPLRKEDAPVSLPRAVQREVSTLSEQITEDEVALRGQIEQLANIMSIRESIRSQRWSFTVTLVALLVAIASLVVAIPAQSPVGKMLRTIADYAVAVYQSWM